jgi:hypothetical protein
MWRARVWKTDTNVSEEHAASTFRPYGVTSQRTILSIITSVRIFQNLIQLNSLLCNYSESTLNGEFPTPNANLHKEVVCRIWNIFGSESVTSIVTSSLTVIRLYCHVYLVTWLIIVGSGSDESIYWNSQVVIATRLLIFTLQITPRQSTQSISTSLHYNNFTVNKSSNTH